LTDLTRNVIHSRHLKKKTRRHRAATRTQLKPLRKQELIQRNHRLATIRATAAATRVHVLPSAQLRPVTIRLFQQTHRETNSRRMTALPSLCQITKTGAPRRMTTAVPIQNLALFLRLHATSKIGSGTLNSTSAYGKCNTSKPRKYPLSLTEGHS